MAFNKYYQDELSYLRELGVEFSHQNPGLSKFLSEEGNDPDVERLFEGVAFLTGRLRQKLDDQLPEITHSLTSLLWPHYLRPLPAMSILEYKPVTSALTEGKKISKGEMVRSVEVDGTACQFRTCYDVDIYPISLTDLTTSVNSDGAEMAIRFELETGATAESMQLKNLRLFLHGDRETHISQALYLWLFRYLDSVHLEAGYKDGRANTQHRLPGLPVSPVGFAEDEDLLPQSNRSFEGYRYLQEFFSLPEKFMFVDVNVDLPVMSAPMLEHFTLRFKFNRQFDSQLRVKKGHVRLFCTPIINLFEHDADPIKVDPRKLEYLVRPDYGQQEHIELFSIDSVLGKQRGRSDIYRYEAFESFEHELNHSDQRRQIFYTQHRKMSTLQNGVDNYLRFVDLDNHKALPVTEIISIELTCTNRQLPETLRAGDIIYPTSDSPEFVTFKNISRVTGALPPPVREGLHWQLIANLALHYRPLSNLESLKNLLTSYDLRAMFDRQTERASKQLQEGIVGIQTETIDRISKGVPVRALQTRMQMRESKFGAKGIQGESSMFLFAAVLSGFFAQYAPINSHHQLIVEGLENGEVYQWKIQPGLKTIL
ncbi:type VI secretion system baseplate subunit TssF [Aliamphritea ceti]|uniref:type VI secretion system baseplate subunit TssF n=1 Tax=Aliamphritea ceti TaxID=1524258 RepID=UPI0021C3857B|nr:type VI secretion system baseplate subunit TssF [Aliamphritea ceti]